ncbi:MAG: hypothetical protein ACYDCQ_01270 [Dehalococcoidia bacterium]
MPGEPPVRLGAGIAFLAGGEAVNLVLGLGSFVLITRLLGPLRPRAAASG